MVLGFDPLIQFMHEQDMAAAICAALCSNIRGVFNVAGPSPLPMSVLVEQSGRKKLWLPESLFALALSRMPSLRLSRGAVDHLKYPVLIDDRPFREATGFCHRLDQETTIASFRSGRPAP